MFKNSRQLNIGQIRILIFKPQNTLIDLHAVISIKYVFNFFNRSYSELHPIIMITLSEILAFWLTDFVTFRVQKLNILTKEQHVKDYKSLWPDYKKSCLSNVLLCAKMITFALLQGYLLAWYPKNKEFLKLNKGLFVFINFMLE